MSYASDYFVHVALSFHPGSFLVGVLLTLMLMGLSRLTPRS